MSLIAFIVAVVALVIFVIDYAQRKTLVTLGLAALTLAWILQLTVAANTVHF